MHKVELRLTNEGSDPTNVFEVYVEGFKDGNYTESSPMRAVNGGGSPIVMFLEADERVIVVAKGNKGRMVFDKDQNANVRVETEEEIAYRKELEAKAAAAQADQAVNAAKSRASEAQESAAAAEKDANTEVRKAEAEKAKLEAEAAKNRAEASKQIPPAGNTTSGLSGPPISGTSQPSKPVGSPASANTGPVDSKQVKS
jgi:hypothetical protein